METRLLNALGAALGVICWGLIIWNHYDPDGPRNFIEGLGENLREWRGYREGMRRTFEDIDSLPELEDDDA